MGRNTIDNNNLEHGLGVGGGRGRPKGSRNGYINPNAAYMKNYEIQGEVADPLNTGLQPQNQQRQRTWAPAPQSNGPTRRMTNQEINTRKSAANNTARTATASRPASSVQGGKMLMEKLLKEQTIPEQTIKEQYLTETKPIETKPVEVNPIITKAMDDPDLDKKVEQYLQNHPEMQSTTANYQAPELNLKKPDPLADAWNGLLEWGRGAWKDISGAATSAIDTGKGWAKSGLDWLNTNVLDPASKWGSQAVNDVSSWIGDRGRDLDRWWNGYQEEGTNVHGSPEKRAQRQEGHVPGVRENIGNWLDQAGRDIAAIPGRIGETVDQAGQWIGDRAEDVNRWWNGYDAQRSDLYGSPEARERRQAGVQVGDHVNGARENIGNWLNQAGRDITSIPGQVGQWVGDRAEDVNRWWNGYDAQRSDLYGSPEARERRQAGIQEGDHVNGARENIGNWLDQTGQNIAAIPGRIGEAVDTMWNGNQVIRGNENGVTSVEGNPGLADRLFNGYVQERPVGEFANEDRRHGVANDQYAQDRVIERVAPLSEQIGNGLDQVGRDIAAIPGNVGNLVQRNIVDPVTNTVKTYLVDPVTNTAVAVADTIQRNVINPVGGTLQQIDQNVIQPAANAIGTAANWTYNNVLQPVGNFVGEQVENLGNTVSTGYRYMQNSGDSRSNEARSAGVSPRVVDDMNRVATTSDAAKAQRDQMFDTMNAALRNGVSPQVVDYLYDAMKSGAIYPSTFMSNLSGLISAAPDVVNSRNAFYASDPYGARKNSK